MSMIYGWISREKFLENHDSERWEPKEPGDAQGSDEPAATPAEAG